MTTETLYHAEIGFPAWFRAPDHTVSLSYTNHARRESNRDRYGSIPILSRLNLSRMKPIELGVTDGKISKILVRGVLDEDRDICMVLIPIAGKPWVVKTVWVNERNDIHRTLNRSRYAAA